MIPTRPGGPTPIIMGPPPTKKRRKKATKKGEENDGDSPDLFQPHVFFYFFFLRSFFSVWNPQDGWRCPWPLGSHPSSSSVPLFPLLFPPLFSSFLALFPPLFSIPYILLHHRAPYSFWNLLFGTLPFRLFFLRTCSEKDSLFFNPICLTPNFVTPNFVTPNEFCNPENPRPGFSVSFLVSSFSSFLVIHRLVTSRLVVNLSPSTTSHSP